MKFTFSKKPSSDKKFEKTLEEYQAAAKKSPDDLRIHIKIAELYLENKYKDKAIEVYRYAATAYTNKKLFQIAIAIYNHILTIDRNLTEVYLTLTQLYLQNGFRGDAVATLEKLAQRYYERGMKSEAKQILQKITEIDPTNSFFKLKVSQFYETTDLEGNQSVPKVSDATAGTASPGQAIIQTPLKGNSSEFFDLEAALQEDQSFSLPVDEMNGGDASEHRSGDNTQMKPYDQIFKELKENFTNAPEHNCPNFYFNLGKAHQELGEFEEAIEEFEKALQNGEKVADSCVQLAKCCRALNRLEKAEEYIRQGQSYSELTKDEKRRLSNELTYDMQVERKKGLLGFVKKIFYANKNK